MRYTTHPPRKTKKTIRFGMNNLSRSQTPQTVKVLNNIAHPKAMPIHIVRKLSENSPKTPKTGQKSPVIKPMGGFLTHN
jgi:hypothetical protein